MRTPLNAVIGFMQLLQANTELTQPQARYVHIMERNALHLVSLSTMRCSGPNWRLARNCRTSASSIRPACCMRWLICFGPSPCRRGWSYKSSASPCRLWKG